MRWLHRAKRKSAGQLNVHVTYDHKVDMAYIYLVPLPPRSVMQTEPLVIDLRSGPRKLINLDFDAEGRLIGIEIEGARSGLPAAVIAGAERIADPKRVATPLRRRSGPRSSQ